MEKLLYKLKEASELLGISLSKLQKILSSGLTPLKRIKVGSGTRILKSDLDNFLVHLNKENSY